MEMEKPILVEKEKSDEEISETEEEESESQNESLIFDETFADVIGARRVKKLLEDYIGLAITHKELFDFYKKKRTLGLILYGPPGTGKTLLIRALSGEYKIPVVTANIAQIISSYVGETAKNIQEIFEKARAVKPCILFLDEFDSLGIKRDSVKEEGTAKIMQDAVNELQTQMSGLQKRGEDLFVIGATNRPWAIEPALKRSGRFEQMIYVPAPNLFDRMALFKYYLKGIENGYDVAVERLARATSGYSASDIKKICEAGKMEAIHKSKESGKKYKITTRTLLKVLRDRETGRNTISEWYNNFIKDVMPKLNDKDYTLYKMLIDDIKTRSGNRGKILEGMRLMSLYVF